MSSLRRRAYRSALTVFRMMPAPLRRFVVRLGSPGFTVGAVCGIECQGDWLMLRQPHRGGWSLPGGLLDRGETPDQAVCRELREETGLAVEVGLPVGTVVVPGVRRVDVVYRIQVAERVLVEVGGEADRADWVKLSDLLGDGADADSATRDIMTLLQQAGQSDPYRGRVLTR